MERPQAPKSFWKFYLSIFASSFTEAYSVTDGYITLIAVLFFFAAIFNREWAHRLQSQWDGLSRWWSIVPIVAPIFYRLLKLNFSKFEAQTCEIETLTVANSGLSKRIDDMLSGPMFSGNFYQYLVYPRTGIVAPGFLNEAWNVAHGRNPLDNSDPIKCDHDIFIEMYVQNDVAAKGSIIEYLLEIEINGTFVKLQREFSFMGWTLEREESQMDARQGLEIINRKVYMPVTDLAQACSGVLEYGKGVEGWLHYVLKDVAHTELESSKRIRLTLADGKGKLHVIDRAWKGEPRPWAIGPDYSVKS